MSKVEPYYASPPDSPYAYAQYYGLCSRCFEIDSTLLPAQLTSDSTYRPEENTDELVDDICKAVLHDEWHITPESEQFLLAVSNSIDTPSMLCESIICFIWSDLTVDLPALFHDHDAHMARLFRQSTQVLSSRDIKIVCRQWQQDEQDSSYTEKLDLRPVQEEKLQVSVETVACIEELLCVDPEVALTHSLHKVPSISALYIREDTPVLRSMSSPVIHSRQPADVVSDSLIPIPSDSDDLWTQELEQEVLAMLDDAFEPLQDISDLNMGCAQHNVDVVSHGSKHNPARAMHDLRLTSPLLNASSQPFESELEAMKSLMPPLTDTNQASDGQDREEDTGAVLHRLAADGLREVNRRLSAERLVEIDTTLRLPISPVKEVLSTMSSLVGGLSEHRLVTSLKLISKEERRWKGMAKIEKMLQWAPFDPSSAVVDLTDELPDKMLPNLEGYEDNALLTKGDRHSMPTKLYNLDDISETDMLEPADMQDLGLGSSQPRDNPETGLSTSDHLQAQASVEVLQPSADIRSLLHKRRLEIEHNANVEGPVAKKHTFPGRDNTSIRMSSLLNSNIVRYISAQGLSPLAVEPPSNPDQRVAILGSASIEHSTKENGQPTKVLIMPSLATSEHSKLQIIVSTQMMARRSLMMEIQKTLPNLTVVERETLHLPQHGSKEYLEADLTVSATAGIVLTTMQKLRQKPLPGQVDRNSLRTKLAHITGSYQKLFLLVSEGNDDAQYGHATHLQPLSDRDCVALSELNASMSFNETKVQVQYIAGGQGELAAWICSIISSAAEASATCWLTVEESMWELFLRIAGCNPFAAQTMLERVKTCDSSRGSLASLATMSHAERTALMQQMLCDSAGSTRLDGILDGPWFQRPKPCDSADTLLQRRKYGAERWTAT